MEGECRYTDFFVIADPPHPLCRGSARMIRHWRARKEVTQQTQRKRSSATYHGRLSLQ